MKKAVSCVNIPVLGISIGDTIGLAPSSMKLERILIEHSGWTFFQECRFVNVPDLPETVQTAISDAFNIGLELGYAKNSFAQFMKIFDAKSVGDVNRAMATCRTMI